MLNIQRGHYGECFVEPLCLRIVEAGWVSRYLSGLVHCSTHHLQCAGHKATSIRWDCGGLALLGMEKLCSRYVLEYPDATFGDSILMVRANCCIWHRLLSWVAVGHPIFCAKNAIVGTIMSNIYAIMIGQTFEGVFAFESLFNRGGFLDPYVWKTRVLVDEDGSACVSLCGELSTHLGDETRSGRDELVDRDTFTGALWFRRLIDIRWCMQLP